MVIHVIYKYIKIGNLRVDPYLRYGSTRNIRVDPYITGRPVNPSRPVKFGSTRMIRIVLQVDPQKYRSTRI